jgi:iron complex transport system substrate-binding protein
VPTRNAPRHPRPRPRLASAKLVVGALAAGTAALAGCGSTSHTATPATSSTTATTVAAAAYPVAISNCGTSTIYTRPPTRAVSNDINTTEDMIALGLESHLVGYFGADGDGPEAQPIPDQYTAGFKAVPEISPDYFTLEKLVGLHPDFLFAGWNYGLQIGTTLTPTNLAKYGIKTLALTESCAHVQATKSAASIDDTYQDLTSLGQIFDIPQKAGQVVDGMKAQIAAARAKVANLPPVTVFDYDSGTSAPFTGPGLAMPTSLIALGGGTNIFAGLKQSWTSVSWEQVVNDNPQCIIINDYGTPTAAQKQHFLETSPITKNLTAVKNHCFLALPYDEVTPGPRNAEAVTAIAKWLHPPAYGLPADGS